MKRFYGLVIGITAILWVLAYGRTIELRAELVPLHDVHRQLAALRHEQEQLRNRQVSDETLAELRGAATAPAPLKPPPSANATGTMAPGEWYSSASWQNRGAGTPRATLETALYAAAGGDVGLFGSLLEINAAVRAKIDDLRRSITNGPARLYPTAEGLVSAVTIKNIPVGDMQLTWYHELSADTAVVGFFLRNPPSAARAANFSTDASEPEAGHGTPPPQLPDNAESKFIMLTFHRAENGWRIVVPGDSTNRLRHELTGG